MSDQDQANTSFPAENTGSSGEGENPETGQHLNRREVVPSLSERMDVRMAALGITPPLPPQSVYREEKMPLPPSPATGRKARKQGRSQSVWQRRWGRFKSIKRGYYAFLLLVTLYLLSFLLPLLVNDKALIVRYNGDTYFPALLDLLPGVGSYYPGTEFGQSDVIGEANYRRLETDLEADGKGNWALMPLYAWNPLESDFSSDKPHPQAPSGRHLLGTDDTGRDVFARLVYGFNISISFSLVLILVYYLLGIIVGGLMGYFGGWVDLIGQRVVEIWENIPFLFMVIIISSMIQPSFIILVLVLAVFQWIGISYYIRGEFFREKARDYVAAAISLGASNRSIIFKHVFPNSLTPIVTFFPFALVGGISVLVSLDFLGFGLQPPTPSWGQLMEIGLANMEHPWLVTTPIAAMFVTLLIVTFIGEAVRAAFDPKVFSRLR